MVDITHKNNTLRIAFSEAIVTVSSENTIRAIENREVPKGDVFEMSKAAGLLAVKRTSDMLPDCHPLPIEYTGIEYEINGLDIHIKMEVKTIYKTGVEVEAMHGASVVALTMYDMLKPIDKGIEIRNIRLVEKKGGKTSWVDNFRQIITAGVIVCSDTVSAGQKEDKAGKLIKERLEEFGVEVKVYEVIPDAKEVIIEMLEANKNRLDLLVYTGGTGLSPRDVTPESLEPHLDRLIPGVMEAARSYGQDRMPWAMLSRGIAGVAGKTLVLTLPGSTGGSKETMDALFPHLLHIFKIIGGGRHDERR